MLELLSVIIPVYNVEEYVERCLDSVINQTYSNLEIIVINDGSTDSSLKICRKFEKIDSRIILIDKENEGLSSTRNLGLDICKGKYVAFLDSDDFIHKDMYRLMIDRLNSSDVDIVSCNSIGFTTEEPKVNSEIDNIISSKIINKEQIFNYIDRQVEVRFEVWNKVFRKSIIGKTRFKPRQVFEDVYFDRRVFLSCDRYMFIDAPLHFYQMDREGNTNSKFRSEQLEIFKEFKGLKDELLERKLFKAYQSLNKYILNFCISQYYLAVSNNVKDKHLEIIKEQYSISFKELKCEINQFELKNRFKYNFFEYYPKVYINLIRKYKK